MTTLDPRRTGLLLRRLATLHAPGHLRNAAPWFILVAAGAFVNTPGGGDGLFYLNWYTASLLVVGAITTFASLPELTDADGRQAYLTLPASDAEKWLATWLYTGPVFVVVYSLAYTLFVALFNALYGQLRPPYTPFALFDEGVWSAVQQYLLLVQPVALLGAIAFNRARLAKVAGVGVAAALALALVAAITVRIVYHDAFTGLFTPIDGADLNLHLGLDDGSVSPWWLGVAFATVLLAASYFRFHEKEV